MFALAFAGGAWLGDFAVKGLGSGYGLADASANEARQFWNKLSADRAARSQSPAELPDHLTYVEPMHVCEGCDAGETRYRQLAEYLGYFDAETTAEAQPASATPTEGADQVPRPRSPLPPGAAVPPNRPRVPASPTVPAPPRRP